MLRNSELSVLKQLLRQHSICEVSDSKFDHRYGLLARMRYLDRSLAAEL